MCQRVVLWWGLYLYVDLVSIVTLVMHLLGGAYEVFFWHCVHWPCILCDISHQIMSPVNSATLVILLLTSVRADAFSCESGLSTFPWFTQRVSHFFSNNHYCMGPSFNCWFDFCLFWHWSYSVITTSVSLWHLLLCHFICFKCSSVGLVLESCMCCIWSDIWSN